MIGRNGDGEDDSDDDYGDEETRLIRRSIYHKSYNLSMITLMVEPVFV